MSYAEQIGDKFYEMNPKDAREGDEIQVGGGWHVMSAYQLDACLLDNQPRRRLVAPGEGWRILPVGNDVPRRCEVLLADCDPIWRSREYDHHTVAELCAKDPNLIAIRQRIPVEAGKKSVESNTGRMICSFCQWSNVGLLNIADTGATPKYICHGCV